MKAEILDIAKRLYHNHLTPETATSLLFDLFSVSGTLPTDVDSQEETFFGIFKKCKPVRHKDYPKSLYFICDDKTLFEMSEGLLYCSNEVWSEMEKFGEYKEWSKVINKALNEMGLKMNVVGCGNWEHCSGDIGSQYKDSVIKSAMGINVIGWLPTDEEVRRAAKDKLIKGLDAEKQDEYAAMIEHDINSWVDCIKWFRGNHHS